VYLRTPVWGPRVAFTLSDQIGLIVEAGYRPLRFRSAGFYELVLPDGELRRVTVSGTHKSAVLWQFPLLLRYKHGTGRWQPYVEAGPSFRLPQDLGGSLGTSGLTAGAGIRRNWRGAGLEPGFRFSHWGATKWRYGQSAPNDVRRNQLDAILAFTF